MAQRNCTVVSYGENSGESYEVTLNAANVRMVMSSEALVERQGKALRKVTVSFLKEGSAELYLSNRDLRILQEAVGFYGVDEDFEF